MPPHTFTTVTPNGIHWHCEQQGTGPHLVLVPSGEGDCDSFAKVASLLSSSFTVTTFDMPGMSRTTAPASALEDLTMRKLTDQVMGLLEKLAIESAAFYGCSSGGAIVLNLVAHHPACVRSAMVHEVAFGSPDQLVALNSLDDAAIVQACRGIFAGLMNADPLAWEALGPAFHARLDKNYVAWVRKYVGMPASLFSKEELTRRPVSWTIGALSPAGPFFANVTTACKADIPISLLECKHFPQVSIPDQLAEYIRSSTLSLGKA